jgi:electron transport complex protein RnfB
MKITLIEQIDNVLPQTQCGLCGHGGCLPYAKAIAQGDTIDKCPPGGISVLEKLAAITEQNAEAYRETVLAATKPASLAVIREAECIGCMKCIKVCPVDAIVGAAKLMHTVITDACTGCELCVPACPVDCIDMHVLSQPRTEAQQLQKSMEWRERFHQHNSRLVKQAEMKAQEYEQALQAKAQADEIQDVLTARKAFIAEAIARAKSKRK